LGHSTLHQADNVAFGIGELRERNHVGNGSHRQFHASAEAYDFVEILLRVINLNVKRNVRRLASIYLSNSTLNSFFGSGINQTVIQGIVGIYVPVKELAVKLLRTLSVFTIYFKMDNRCFHVAILS